MQDKHLLLVEDEENIRFVMSFILEDAGYKVTTVENGQVALQKIKESQKNDNSFDLLITDMQMPKMTGLELVKKLQFFDIFIPTIIITGYDDENTLAQLKDSGCEHFLEKPLISNKVKDCVAKIFREICEKSH